METDQIEWVVVRGVNIPKTQLEEMAGNGCTLLDEILEAGLIKRLDRELKRLRVNKGVYPEGIVFPDDLSTIYVPKPLVVKDPVTGIGLTVYHKPAWFRHRKYFTVGAKV